VINVVLFVLNLLTLASYRLEQIYSLVCTILFLIASILMVWFVIVNGVDNTRFIIGTVLIVVQFVLFLYDLKILRGETLN
jgi:K+ transporter